MVLILPRVLQELSRMRTPAGFTRKGWFRDLTNIPAGKSCRKIFRKQERILEKEGEMHTKLHRLSLKDEKLTRRRWGWKSEWRYWTPGLQRPDTFPSLKPF